MAYGSDSSSIKEVNRLSHGVHDDVNLVKIEAFTTEAKEGGDGKTYEVLDYIYKDKSGAQHQERFFNPDNDTDAERQGKSQKWASDYAVYVAKKIFNKEMVLDGSKITDWKSFTTAVLTMFGKGYETVPLSMKLLGNVYKGKANIVQPRYFGFLERMDSGLRPIMGAKEVIGNQAYDDFFKKDEKGDGGTNSSQPTEKVVF